MEYDVLIVGSRVAGASLGLLLAQRGYRVLMVERDHFPSDTMSTHFMNTYHVPLLMQIGVLDDLLAAGFRKVVRSRSYVDDCLFEGALAPNGGFALAPRRDFLDALLVERAQEYGAEFVNPGHVERLLWDEERVVGAVVASRGQEPRAVRARLVVGADGKFSSVAKWVDAAVYHAVPAMRPGYYAHVQGLEPLPEPALEIFFGGDQIGFIFPMRPDEDCIALELQPEDFDEMRAAPQAAFERRFRALPGMARRLRDARIDGKVIGIKGVENYFRQPYGPGWALTGDAGYCKDPSTGLGIGDALQQSFWLADALDRWFAGGDWEAEMRAFQQTRDEAMMPFYQSTLGFTEMRDPAASDIAWIKAVLASPLLLRNLAYRLPAAMPELLPANMFSSLQGLAKMFGAATDSMMVADHA